VPERCGLGEGFVQVAPVAVVGEVTAVVTLVAVVTVVTVVTAVVPPADGLDAVGVPTQTASSPSTVPATTGSWPT
jgi:hypothetical protein